MTLSSSFPIFFCFFFFSLFFLSFFSFFSFFFFFSLVERFVKGGLEDERKPSQIVKRTRHGKKNTRVPLDDEISARVYMYTDACPWVSSGDENSEARISALRYEIYYISKERVALREWRGRGRGNYIENRETPRVTSKGKGGAPPVETRGLIAAGLRVENNGELINLPPERLKLTLKYNWRIQTARSLIRSRASGRTRN